MLLPSDLTVLLLAAVLPLVQAQTTTKCDPLLVSCPPVPGLSGNLKTNFAAGSYPPPGWHTIECKGINKNGPGGATLGIAGTGDCPGIETDGAALFGYFEVKARSSPGQGIISSIVLESLDRDEVDWEFLGGENYRVQSNYFGKGDNTTFDRMKYIPVPDNQNTYHTYAINWTSAAITYFVDGAAVRTITYDEAKGGTRFPQTPMHLRIGSWSGGDSGNSPGIIEWAGGVTDYSKGPFNMLIESASIINYSPAKQYVYKDKSGSWQSIDVVGGTVGGIVNPGQVQAQQPSGVSSSTQAGTTASTSVLAQSSVTATSQSQSVSTAVKANGTVVIAPSSTSNSTVSVPSKAPSSSPKPAVTTNDANGMYAANAGVGLTTLLALFMVIFC